MQTRKLQNSLSSQRIIKTLSNTIILFIECLKIAGNRSALYYWLNLKKDSADIYTEFCIIQVYDESEAIQMKAMTLKLEAKDIVFDFCYIINNSNSPYVIIMSRMSFRVNLHSIVAWMSRNSLLEAGAIFEV